MTYDEFVQRYCGGKTPVAAQEEFIRAFLNLFFYTGESMTYPRLFWNGARQSGRTQVRGWLDAFLHDQEHLERYGCHLPKCRIDGDLP